MKSLVLVLSLVSIISFSSTVHAGDGDVYSCEEIQHINIEKDGLRKVDLDKFEFKITDKIIELESSSTRFSNKK